MSTDLYASFNEQYMNINTKLKKRFMRKPNISEATNEFVALAIQCEHSEQPAFAGQAYVGAAKCEASAGNFLGEAEYNLAAARQYMKAEKKLRALKFSSPDRENLEAAIGCYTQALSRYPENSTMKTSIMLELANSLSSIDNDNEALECYQLALQPHRERHIRARCMRTLVNLYITVYKYDLAWETANSLIDNNLNLSEDILSEVQISRVLLTLIVEPMESKKPPSLKQLISGILHDISSNVFPVSADCRLKLQSIIMAFTEADVQAFVTVAADFRRFLTMKQVELMDKLYMKMTGMDQS